MMRKIFIVITIIILSTNVFAQKEGDGLAEYADSVFLLFHKNKKIKKDTLHISKIKSPSNNSHTKDSINIFNYFYSFGEFKNELSFFQSTSDSLYVNEPNALLFYLLNQISSGETGVISTYDDIVEEYLEKGQCVDGFEKNNFIENSGFYKDLIIHDKEYGQDRFDLYLCLATDLDPNWGWRRVDFPDRKMKYETFMNMIHTGYYDKYKVKIVFRGASKRDKYDIKRIRVAFFDLYNSNLIGDGIVSKKQKIIRD